MATAVVAGSVAIASVTPAGPLAALEPPPEVPTPRAPCGGAFDMPTIGEVYEFNGVCQVVYASIETTENEGSFAKKEGTIFTFTPPTGVDTVDVFLVGGGGGGGGGATNADLAAIAGGGGAGGSLAIHNGVAVSGPVTVTVGAGGSGGLAGASTSPYTSGADGSDGVSSSFGPGVSAFGGGGGKGGNATTKVGGAGGATPSNDNADDSAPAPVIATAAIGDGGTGATIGAYWSAGGGGGSPGDVGDNASATGESPSDYVLIGGTGGAPAQLFSQDPASLFTLGWESSLGLLNTDAQALFNAYQGFEVPGFAPGGGGAASYRDDCYLSDPTCASGDAGAPNSGGGLGSVARSLADIPEGSGWDRAPDQAAAYTARNRAWFGAGGGGGIATDANFTGESGPLYDGSDGTSGFVVVRYEAPLLPDCVVTETEPDTGVKEVLIDESCAWTVPDGVTGIDVAVVEGGGGGGAASALAAGGGAAGGAAACLDVPVTAGHKVGAIVGLGGKGGVAGGASGGNGSMSVLTTEEGGFEPDGAVDPAGGDVSAAAFAPACPGGGGMPVFPGVGAANVEISATVSGRGGGFEVEGQGFFNDGADGEDLHAGGSGLGLYFYMTGPAPSSCDGDTNECDSSGIDGSSIETIAMNAYEGSAGLFAGDDRVVSGSGAGGNNTAGPSAGGAGGGGRGGNPTNGVNGANASYYGGGGGGGYYDGTAAGDGGDGGDGVVIIRYLGESTGTPVVVKPVATQTIAYGQTPDLSWTDYVDDVEADLAWDPAPTCLVYETPEAPAVVLPAALTLVETRPVPVGNYVVKCGDGTPPDGYAADYDTTGELIVTKAKAPLNYTGTSGVVPSGGSVSLTAALSPATCTGDITYTVNGSAAPATYPDDVYEIIATYAGDDNCEAATVYAIVLVGGTAAASSGGGHYNVSAAGRVNFGYTVQLSKSRTGATQVSGQMLWNARNGKFRFKGNIAGFVKTSTDCVGGVCGNIVGTGTLRRIDESSGQWVVTTGVTYKARVIDGGTVTVCSKKNSCTTTNRADSFGLELSNANVTGEQAIASTGWPTPVQLGGGNVLIK